MKAVRYGAAFVFGDVMKKWAEKFYNSKKWKCCRNAYISERILIDGGLCEVCGESTGYIVHHKISLDSSNINNPEIALNNKNGEIIFQISKLLQIII